MDLLRRAVHQQHRFALREIHHAPAAIVGRDRVVLQRGLDHMLARLGKEHLHTADHGLSRRDLADQDRRQLVALGL